MRGARVFLDTNIIVYAFDASSPDKRSRSLELIEQLGNEHRLVLSTQVLQESYNVLTRKLDMSGAIAERALRTLARHHLIKTDAALLWAAMNRHQNGSIAFYDSIIVEAAIRGECGTLLSEDLQDGRRYGTLTIDNPYAS